MESGLESAFTRLRAATNACMSAANDLIAKGSARETREQFDKSLDELNNAIAEIVCQAERYIRGDN